ncbi:MAG: hypothetical protein RIF46_09620 [Cyclobacteriaceae bacterium]
MDYVLESTEIIEHYEFGNQKIQTIYKSLNTGLLTFLDTSVVFQFYDDSLLLEEIQYDLKDGDSTKWSHKILTYNTFGQIASEVDSLEGYLMSRSIYYYQGNKEMKADFFMARPKYDESMNKIGWQINESTILSFYNDSGQCFKTVGLSKNELASEFFGETYDSTITFHKYDDQQNRIKSISLEGTDTTNIITVEYDKQNRERVLISKVKGIDSLTVGNSKHHYEYDERNNRIREHIIFGDYEDLMIIYYDQLNRPIKREYYRPKNAY